MRLKAFITRLVLFPALLAAGILVVPGCTETTTTTAESDTVTAAETTSTVPDYQRQQVEFYRGISEPRSEDLPDMVKESDRLLADNINAVSILPPILIEQRAGGTPRVILEGAADSAESSIDGFHDAGLAVHLAPTTEIPGYNQQVEASDINLEHLTEDVLEWAATAESRQVELFSPLSQYNLVLGTGAANLWSREVLPEIRQVYHGDIAAKVVPDLSGYRLGARHNFEDMDYTGYDYLLLDLFPSDYRFTPEIFERYVNEIMDRGVAVAQRDGLKGVMVGEFGGWREKVGVYEADGPELGTEGQKIVAQLVLDAAMPDFFGAFFQGWTLPGRGARDFPVEETLKEYYGSSMVESQEDDGGG